MTIMKAIALAALTGTLAFGPEAVLASSHKNDQSTERGNSAAAKADKADKADKTDKATRSEARETAKANRASQQDADDGAENDVSDDESGKLRAGPIVSALRSGNFSSDTGMLDGTVVEIDLSELPGNSEIAVIKALESADLPEAGTTIEASATADPRVETALETIDDENADYAFITADGTLVVVVP